MAAAATHRGQSHRPGQPARRRIRGAAPRSGTERYAHPVIVDVSDNGPGVPADQIRRIFDRFYRAGNQAPRAGSGPGLAIVTEIAAAHQGTAEATLNHPCGLRVTLTLPTWNQPCPAKPPPAGAAPDALANPAV